MESRSSLDYGQCPRRDDLFVGRSTPTPPWLRVFLMLIFFLQEKTEIKNDITLALKTMDPDSRDPSSGSSAPDVPLPCRPPGTRGGERTLATTGSVSGRL